MVTESNNDFPPSKRLLTSADYSSVFQRADYKVGDRHFLLLARENLEPHARLGLVIAKKKVRRAVDRNKIKRHCRDSFRLKPLPSLDIVLLAKPGIGELPSAALRKKLSRSWLKLEQLHNKKHDH